MVSVPSVGGRQSGLEGSCAAGVAVKPHSRQIGHGKRRVTIKMVGFNEPLKQVPTHLGRFIEARTEGGGRTDAPTSTGVASNGAPAGLRARELPPEIKPQFSPAAFQPPLRHRDTDTVTLTPQPQPQPWPWPTSADVLQTADES